MDAADISKRIKVEGASGGCPLPEEIVEDILSRLPARSLCRFRCVSRSFDAVISSRAFQDTHYQRNSGDRRLFVRPPGVQEPFYAWHPCTGAGGPAETIMSPRRLPQGSTFPVSKSCRGLVLLKNTEHCTHHVWNPSTGEILTLPDKEPLRARCLFVSYGLCYCPATQRHKVVRLYNGPWGSIFDGYGAKPATICEVFTLNESAYWRPAATEPPPCHPRENYRQLGVFCDGNLHFLDQCGGITVFNVEDETFGTLDPPPVLQRWSNFQLTELGGSLCIYSIVEEQWRSYRECKHIVDVWLLKDYTAAAKWERLCCIDCGDAPEQVERQVMLKSSWIAPLDMYYDGSNQRKIVFGTEHCNVFIVDPNNGTTKLAFTLAIGGRGRRPSMGFFEESLARVGTLSENTAFASPWMRAWSEVLSRLPALADDVWSLNQVCRGWRAIIKSEHFVAAHLRRANPSGKSLQMVFFSDAGMPYAFEPVGKYIDSPGIMPPLVDSRCTIICSKPCHGLNLLSLAYSDFVCNPATRYFKALPPDDDISVDAAMFTGRLGLGYEQESSRHVLVRLAYTEKNLTTRDYKMVCHMKYLEDIIWDEVDPPPRPIANMLPAHVNGKLYWMVETELGQSSSGLEMIELDVSKRKFEVLKGPPCGRDSGEHMSINELEEMVCVICSNRTVGIIRIWAMEDTGMWSAKYDIQLERFSPEYSPETTMPLAVDPKDGRILLSTGRTLGYYNPKTAELETIYHLGKHTEGMKFVPALFQESLVNPCHYSV
ncbi:hypothetical protein SETIT_9G212500v2 [Setaria italica]|uniref:F-box domain-containing protein n=2 Tax=Setaria TaxID=4554 RepID=A0A368SIW8_SETIT|nr:hypothetical protein SETIT_9G212500v2 [Setaria italica]TKV93210.1 hypothetical protein SEVIR_9G211200v2 [Setaria viridis]